MQPHNEDNDEGGADQLVGRVGGCSSQPAVELQRCHVVCTGHAALAFHGCRNDACGSSGNFSFAPFNRSIVVAARRVPVCMACPLNATDQLRVTPSLQ